MLRTGLTLGAVLIPLQILAGDLHGLNTLEHQPQKIAAMEGIWQTERGAPLLLFALPDEKHAQQPLRDRHSRSWRRLILTHETDGEIKGLDEFPDAHPPVAPVFFGFRIMVGIGMLMLAVQLGRACGCIGAAAGVAAAACRGRCCGCWRHDASRAGSPRWRAGTSPRSAASPSSSTA